MHCVHLGLMKKLFNLWLDTKNHKMPWYMKKKNQDILNKRLLNIKPVSEILRKPKSIFSKGDFKANEFRSLLLFYLPFALPGLLEHKYVKHFRLLSSAIYVLSKQKISSEEIEIARDQLNEFVDSFETLYGQSNVTINTHLIRHLAESVINLGPLWAHCAYSFEANNGVVAKGNTCTNDIVHQLTWKYVMRNTIPKDVHTVVELSMNGKQKIKIDSADREFFINE